MPNKQPNPNAKLSDGIHGVDNTDTNIDMSGPLWESRMVSLGDYIQYMREVSEQSYQSYIASESDKPSKSSQSDCDGSNHAKCDTWCASSQCVHGCNRECNCNGEFTCIDDERLPPSIDGNKQCPESGKVCNDRVCPSKCLGEQQITEGIPSPQAGSQRKSEYRWTGPGVIVGAVCEAWTDAAKRISGSFNKPISSGSSKASS